jgi:hypothetical protein
MPYSKKGGKVKPYPGPTSKLRKIKKPAKTMRKKK